jgi:hypothetical protein
MLACFTAAPRIGHFNAMLHIFGFVHYHHNSKLVFDDDKGWREFYPDAKEDSPKCSQKIGKTGNYGLLF